VRLSTLFVFLLLVNVQGQLRPTQAESYSANLPVQKIGRNDLVSITVYDSPEFSRVVRIGSEGDLRLPMLKQRVKAEGLLPVELENAIAAALNDEHLVVEPVVTVTVSEYQSRPISVAGSVRKPVTFQATSSVTLLDALTRAEGLSADAGSEILISRPQSLMAHRPAWSSACRLRA